ncbi:hypothetical protein BDZ90DRAFT_231737 [Jaminaea rosea]|uniref:Uncharacterized protein n=1 Tax=Jaminaea rosea TaxID=1569628 RepID=A0A316URM0_9BASI|nr:hypothetical protein BDZ90DRAFT_231737 [Jaminaea rosea]PWN27959.1 hypothetical protein BDZ90DRAFT_231737 [Jaminaea rosea]
MEVASQPSTSSPATGSRPGADPLYPHADLLVPSASSSRPSSSPSLAHPLWANSVNSSALHFGSIAPSSPSRSPPTAHEQAIAMQVASLHRAAEVARWDWSKDHQVDITATRAPSGATQSSSSHTPLARNLDATSRSTGVGMIDLSDSGSETLSGGESTTTSSSSGGPGGEEYDADAIERAFVAQMEGRLHPSWRSPPRAIARRGTEERSSSSSYYPQPQPSRPRNAVTTGNVDVDMETWNRMCFDLGCAAGVVDDGEQLNVGSSSAHHAPPPPFLFGYTPGSRLLPHPWWARRYSGPAGAWLRGELLRRGRDTSTSASAGAAAPPTTSNMTPASAVANEWRRSIAAASDSAPTQREREASTDAVPMLSFPSLDPSTREGTASTGITVDTPGLNAVGRRRVEMARLMRQQYGTPSTATATPPPATVSADANTSLAVPSRTPASAIMTSLSDPWRATPVRSSPSNVTSTNQLLATSSTPSSSSPPRSTNSNVTTGVNGPIDRSATRGVLELSNAARQQALNDPDVGRARQRVQEVLAQTQAAAQGEEQRRATLTGQAAIGSGRPAGTTSAASPNEPLPESAFQIPATGEAQRREATDAVARMAAARRESRTAAATLESGSASNAASDVTRQRRTEEQRQQDRQQRQARREGHGMSYLRHLRSLDGIDGPPAAAAAASTSAPSGSNASSSSPPRSYHIFPWYTPPALDLADTQEARPSSSSHVSNITTLDPLIPLGDPNGDAVGSDWYRGVRARQESAQEAHAARRALDDPNGELLFEADNESDPAAAGITTAQAELHNDPIPPWRFRSTRARARAREREDDGAEEGEEGRQGAARRQRNRTALVVATEDVEAAGAEEEMDADEGYVRGLDFEERATRRLRLASGGASGRNDHQDPSATTRGTAAGIGGGWTLVNPAATAISPIASPLQQPQPQDQEQHSSRPSSPMRETSDEGAPGVTMWLRGPGSSSPVQMNAATSTPSTSAAAAPVSPPTSIRSLRRPRRLRSLASEDISNASLAASSASLPMMTTSRTSTTPVRRAEHHGRSTTGSGSGTGVGEEIRSMSIDQLREREERAYRSALGEATTATTPAPNPAHSPPASTDPAASSSSTSISSPWLTRISQNIEAELSARQAELRASQQRLGEELARRRRHLDELRQREGRIGRVLESTESALRGSQARTTGDSGQNSMAAGSSLVRRRTLRDPAPAGLRAPRAVRLSQPASDPPTTSTSSSSGHLRRATSSGTLGEDKDSEERQAVSSSSAAPSSSLPRAVDDLALTSRSSSGSGSAGTSSSLPGHASTYFFASPSSSTSPSLITPHDQSQLDPLATRVLRSLDTLGQRAGHYQEAALQAHRQRLLTWAPQQPELPTSNVSASSPSETQAYALRFEVSRREPQPSGARAVLRHDQNGLRFTAQEGLDVVLRFLAALPGTTSVTSTATAYPRTRLEEDRAWSAGRSRLLRSTAAGGAVDAHEAHNERRRALGMAPRERREASTTTAGTASAALMSTTALNSGGPSGRSPWPQILARRPDLTPREVAVLSRFTATGGTSSDDSQSAPIQQPFTRTSSLSALRSLSSDDIDVLRGLVLRTTQGPGGFAASASTAATMGGASEGAAHLDEAEQDDATPSITPAALPGPALPSLFPSQAIPLSSEDLAAINAISAELSLSSTIAEDDHLFTRLASMPSALALIQRRADAIRAGQQGHNAGTSDPLGPLFTLSSLSVTVTRKPPLSEEGRAQQLPTSIQALVFVSDSPIEKAALREWEGKSATDVQSIVAAAVGDGGAVGPGLALRQERDEEPHWDEEADLGDPYAMDRREAVVAAQRQRAAAATTSTTSPVATPSLLPRGMLTFHFPSIISPSTPSPGDISLLPTTLPQTLNFARDSSSSSALPIGRYLSVKLLPTTPDAQMNEKDEATEGAQLELSYVGAKGWPTAGRSSTAVGMRDA